jgi:formate dehydrogenase subunit gamma
MTLDHPWDRAAVIAIVNALKHEPGALMPILRRIQDGLGWVPPASIPLIAHELNLSRAEVHGVVSFYHDFRHEPPGRNVIRGRPCESRPQATRNRLRRHQRRRRFHARSGVLPG